VEAVSHLDPYQQSKKEWKESTLKQTLARKPERKKKFITTSSMPIERLYVPQDTSPESYLKNINLPGQYPYTRGVHATGYRGRLWTMRMFAGFGTAEETNAAS
jgi:methylmalonyl-CoA mutase N-terminal domain/subunit